MAVWWIKHATSRFANGDAFLDTPQIEPTHLRGWDKLRDYYRTIPIDRWLGEAHLWLEVLGPPVPTVWKNQWPQILPHESEHSSDQTGRGGLMLQQLARAMQHQQCLEQSFDRRLHMSKLGALKQLPPLPVM